jgi:peptidyl-tRNA hydrolase
MNKQLIKKYNITAKDIAVIEDHLNYSLGYEYLENRFSFSELEVILDTWTI